MSGPTGTLSLAVFATMAPLAGQAAPPIKLVLTLALLVGLLQLAMGLALSAQKFHSPYRVVGFTAGAALVIAAQLRSFFRDTIAAGSGFLASIRDAVLHAGAADPWIVATALVTLAASWAARRVVPRIPHMLVAMIAGSAFAYLLAITGEAEVPMIGTLPQAFPPLSLPSFDLAEWRRLAPPALALTVLALAQAVSVARAVAVKSGQRLDGNQEFIGQGLSNIVGAFTSSYPSSGSFNRVWLNYDAGAKTPLAACFSAGFLLVIVLAVAPLGAHLPLAVMAALLVLVALGLIDVVEMRRIVRASRGEGLVLLATFLSALVLQLEFAIFLGVLTSLLLYLNRTTHPHLTPVAPDTTSRHRRFADPTDRHAGMSAARAAAWTARSSSAPSTTCARSSTTAGSHAQRHLLLIGTGISCRCRRRRAPRNEAKLSREAGGALYLCKLKPRVAELLARGGFLELIGRDNVFDTKDEAIRAIYARLDSERCRVCTARIFSECQVLLPDGSPRIVQA
jgi:SulP family sulfate permease